MRGITRCSAPLGAVGVLFAAGTASGQTTVPYTDPSWADFGTTNITSVMGNFMPGWTTLTGTPDLGPSPFFVPVQTLSGDPTDGALWFLKIDPSNPTFPANESAELSLSGFIPGQIYQLNFFATIVDYTLVGWSAPADTLDIRLTGANITTFSTTVLTDPIPNDGLNEWVPQSMTFTATSPIITFGFNEFPVSVDPAFTARIGIDGVKLSLIPAPSSAAVAFFAAGALTRRRR